MGQTIGRAGATFEAPRAAIHGKSPWERRHSFRISVPARASLWKRGELRGYYTVLDISLGGCSLDGGPTQSLGEHMDMVLHVPHRAPIVLSASVVRTSPSSVGLRFEATSPIIEEELQDIVVETYARERTRDTCVSLVVEPRHAARHTLVRTLRELGKRAVGVATALDAVQLLVEEGSHVDTVFIEAESASLPSLELVEFLAHNHPGVRRVLIGDAAHIAQSWLAETSGEVHALLDTACDRETLHRCLRKLDRSPLDRQLS